MTDLREIDAGAAGSAVRMLNEAGLNVSKIGEVKKNGEGGVEFNLEVHANTRYDHFWNRLEHVKSAAMEAGQELDEESHL